LKKAKKAKDVVEPLVARKELGEALELDPNLASARVELADLYAEIQSEKPRALSEYIRALSSGGDQLDQKGAESNPLANRRILDGPQATSGRQSTTISRFTLEFALPPAPDRQSGRRVAALWPTKPQPPR